MGVILAVSERPRADPAIHVAVAAINAAISTLRGGNVTAAALRVAVVPHADDLAAPAVAERVDDATEGTRLVKVMGLPSDEVDGVRQVPARPVKSVEATVARTLRTAEVEGATRPATAVRNVPPDGSQNGPPLKVQGVGPEHLEAALRALVDLLAGRAHGVGPTRQDRRFRLPGYRPSGVRTPVADATPGIDHLVHPATSAVSECSIQAARTTAIRTVLAVAAPEDAVATPVRGETAHLPLCVLARPTP